MTTNKNNQQKKEDRVAVFVSRQTRSRLKSKAARADKTMIKLLDDFSKKQ